MGEHRPLLFFVASRYNFKDIFQRNTEEFNLENYLREQRGWKVYISHLVELNVAKENGNNFLSHYPNPSEIPCDYWPDGVDFKNLNQLHLIESTAGKLQVKMGNVIYHNIATAQHHDTCTHTHPHIHTHTHGYTHTPNHAHTHTLPHAAQTRTCTHTNTHGFTRALCPCDFEKIIPNVECPCMYCGVYRIRWQSVLTYLKNFWPGKKLVG